jgi:hypothetical protein
MATAYQELPKLQAGTGYRQLETGGLAGTTIGSTLIYATIGVALGIAFGTAFASSSLFTNTSSASTVLGQVTASAAETKVTPVANVQQAPKLESSPTEQGIELLASAAKLAGTPAVHPVPVRKRVPALRRSNFRSRLHFPRRAVPAVAKTSPSTGIARVAYAVERYSFVIEGDVTVVDFDASAGTIETHEGKRFVIGTKMAQNNAIPWEDYRSNLHYRCDQAGSCTLMRAGVVVPNARLSL